MADIFQEVDEEVRRDKALALWKKYGSYVAIACLAVVLGTAARVGWREYKTAQRNEESGRFVAAAKLLEQGDTVSAITSFQSLGAEANTGYGLIAGFQEAAARANSGDVDGAVAAFDAIANDGGADEVFRNLAQLQAVMVLIDAGPAEDINQRLQPLLTPNGPWRHSAQELQAVLQQREGDLEGARTSFKTLSEDATAPAGIRARAGQMLAALGG
ncbi:MAG: tetratricopeptide repeat protein [Alphaproteobacteria bacterium]|nr:tetratricopeptide repeat protein [Alphaproteobacteria bacterium]MDP6568054.1 tetratricopeptide repeat protein [Alphaproteobacteria bacterium]MDP6813378.1 tetratricopeptide repeat protein [Alphaproteobacteria bacterium]